MTWVTKTRTTVSTQTRTERFDSDGNGSLDGSRTVVDRITNTETYQEYVPSEQPGRTIDPGEGAIRNVTTQLRTDTFDDADRNGAVGSHDAFLYSQVETFDGRVNEASTTQAHNPIADPYEVVSGAGTTLLGVDPAQVPYLGALEGLDVPISTLEQDLLLYREAAEQTGTISIEFDGSEVSATDDGEPITGPDLLADGGDGNDRYESYDAQGQLIQIEVADPSQVRIEEMEDGRIRVHIESESVDPRLGEEEYAASRTFEFENAGAVEVVGIGDDGTQYLSTQWVFDTESGDLYSTAVYPPPGQTEDISVTYYQPPNESYEPLTVQYQGGATAPGEWHGVPSSANQGSTELGIVGGVITNPNNPSELLAAYQSPQTVELGLWMATGATTDWQASAEQAIAEGRFPGITDVSQLMSFDSPEGVQLFMEVAAAQGAEAGAAFEADLIAAGMEPSEAALYASQLERQYVVGTLNTAINATLSSEDLQNIQEAAEVAATEQLGIPPDDPRFPTAVAGIAQGLLMAQAAPVLDGYGAFYANTVQADYQQFVALGGSLEDFVQNLALEQGLSPSANPLEFSIIRNIALANDPAVSSLSESGWNTFFEFPWQDYEAVQAGAPPPPGYHPPSAELLSVYEATQRVDTAINTGVIDGWREQHDRYVQSWLGEGGMLDQIDQANGGAFAEGLLSVYENFNLLNLSPGGSVFGSMVGFNPTLESIFGQATSREEAEAAIRALDAEMQGFFDSLDPSAMSFPDLLNAESSFETLLKENASGAGDFGQAYAQSLGYASVGGEILKTVGVVGATLLTFSGVGTGAGAAFLGSVLVGTGTRIGLDLLDHQLEGESYSWSDLGDSVLQGAFDSSTALISYIGSAHAFQAASAAGQAWGLSANQATWLGRLAGFGAETAIDGSFTMGSSLASGQSFEEGLFNVAVGAGINLAFSSAFGFDYDTRVVNRTLITEGPDAGSFRFTLADGTEQILPQWAGNLHVAATGHATSILDMDGVSPLVREELMDSTLGYADLSAETRTYLESYAIHSPEWYADYGLGGQFDSDRLLTVFRQTYVAGASLSSVYGPGMSTQDALDVMMWRTRPSSPDVDVGLALREVPINSIRHIPEGEEARTTQLIACRAVVIRLEDGSTIMTHSGGSMENSRDIIDGIRQQISESGQSVVSIDLYTMDAASYNKALTEGRYNPNERAELTSNYAASYAYMLRELGKVDPGITPLTHTYPHSSVVTMDTSGAVRVEPYIDR